LLVVGKQPASIDTEYMRQNDLCIEALMACPTVTSFESRQITSCHICASSAIVLVEERASSCDAPDEIPTG
jgi:uncharacterized protein YuzB (UPF0349 family)